MSGPAGNTKITLREISSFRIVLVDLHHPCTLDCSRRPTHGNNILGPRIQKMQQYAHSPYDWFPLGIDDQPGHEYC